MGLTNHVKARIAEIVRQALNRLSDLQQQIDMFMEFLIKIQTMVKITSERSDWIFTPAQNREERRDADIQKVRL
jgi:F0F1-type ATP synthase delta subunit